MLLLNEEYFYNIYDHFGFKQQLWQAMTDLDHRTSDSGDDFVWKLCIPKAHARLETDVLPKLDDVEKVEHYEIYVFKQVGTARNRRDCFVLCKFPNTDRYFRVILHMYGGVSYAKDEHKYMLRLTDELDRRIVLGFCMMYQGNLTSYSYDNQKFPDRWILSCARDYTANDMPKRLKQGSAGNFYNYKNLEPYEEANIFRDVVLI